MYIPIDPAAKPFIIGFGDADGPPIGKPIIPPIFMPIAGFIPGTALPMEFNWRCWNLV